jgi:hypothetical protein
MTGGIWQVEPSVQHKWLLKHALFACGKRQRKSAEPSAAKAEREAEIANANLLLFIFD